jgi:outer membrane protein OmpA-like peptidoglycan-associated protein
VNMTNRTSLTLGGLLTLQILNGTPAQAEPYKAHANAHHVEIGVFGGATIFSESHELYDESTKTQSPFRFAEPTVGLRLAYYPLSFLGLEAEGGYIPAESDAGKVDIFTVKGHLIGQLPYRVAPFLLVGGGAHILSSNVMGNDTDPEFHYGGGLKIAIVSGLMARFDARHVMGPRLNRGLDEKNIANHVELLGGLSLAFGGVTPDRDDDGVHDDEDQCPDQAGIPPDGCPDTDSDGISDRNDKCPNEAGDAKWEGCPDPDADKDGVLRAEDKCPDVAGIAPTGCPDTDGDGFVSVVDLCPDVAGVEPDGCPPKDPDQDGLIGAADQCPEQAETPNHFQDSDGCPDEVPEEVKRFTGSIKGITFATGSSVITPSSYGTLDKAAAVLREYPDLRLEIQGHTDSSGSDETNLKVSTKRAEAVRQYMVNTGVAPGRIEARGYGETTPVADNKTSVGRAENRRIEFKLIGQAEPAAPSEASDGNAPAAAPEGT